MRMITIFTFGTIGAGIAALFGGWDLSFQILLGAMVLDYITGMIVAGFFKNSKKTKSGGLNSSVGFKGICKKCGILFMVLVGVWLDILLHLSYVRDAVCLAYIANEIISIIENLGRMNVPIPNVIINAIDVLKQRTERKEG